jgi:hypothetical protein
MIEFTGECGHTIRAGEENAGKVVRCSYCGREAMVPNPATEPVSSLLNEVERTGEPQPEPRRWWASRRRPPPTPEMPAPTLPRGGVDPVAVVLKMCYAAIIITVLIVGGRAGYRHWKAGLPPSAAAQVGPKEAHAPSRSGPAEREETQRATVPDVPISGSSARGLLRPTLPLNQSGVFFSSVPSGAMAYLRRARDASEASILKDRRVMAKIPAGQMISLPPDRYQVAVAIKMTAPELMRLPGYAAARRQLESATAKAEEQGKALEAYFLPDRANRVALETLGDYSQVVVRYYEMEVVAEVWTPLTALYLPRSLELSQLLAYLPTEKVYGFDAEAIRTELSFRQVPEKDQPVIIEALSRIGMIPYRLEKWERKDPMPSYRLFFLSIVDGMISTTLLN